MRCLLLISLALAHAGMLLVVAHRPAGCETSCGGVDIPYPFGIGERCALDAGVGAHFNIRCDLVNGTKRPYRGSSEVTMISVADAKVWTMTTISKNCYPEVWQQREPPLHRLLDYSTYTPFKYSYVDNKMLVIGCNIFSFIVGFSYKNTPLAVSAGCSSTCFSHDMPRNGSCSGSGCCEADVPKGLDTYYAYFKEIDNSSEIWKHSPCSYMVIMEKAAFNYSTKYIFSTTFWDEYGGKVPVVMDWTIGLDTCKAATTRKSKKSSYACISDNSECVDSTNGPGYRCKCLDGYQGNPYLMDGCKDINECLDSTRYPCPGVCENTPGNFTCTCPPRQEMVNGACKEKPKLSSWVKPVIGTSAGAVVFVITMVCTFLIKETRKLRRVRQKYFQQHGGMILFEAIKSQQGVAFRIFSEAELQRATDNFSDKRVVGHGGQGNVYTGLLEGNLEVAVKRCITIDEQHKKEFGKEMLILSQINHKNIVKLLGCCLEVQVPMLVYEFIRNGTLFQLIHGSTNDEGGSRHISLATRVQIAHQSADALAYLHSSASPPIIHGDVKSSNILIDRDSTVKVSDFGASILAPTDASQFVTLVQGTCGYLDPEYMQTCKLTDKSDVYSFGVVLLELLTHKRPFNLEGPEEERSLTLWFISTMEEGMVEEILDDQISNKDDNLEVLREIAELAMKCLQICGANRPSMREVAERLSRLSNHPSLVLGQSESTAASS